VREGAGSISGAQIKLRMEDSPNIIASAVADAEGNYIITLLPEKETDYVLEITKPSYLLNSIALLHTDQPGFRKSTSEVAATENVLQIHTSLTPVVVEAEQVLGGIYFDFNKTTLLPEHAIVLDKLYAFLKENPGIRLQISGHTDNINSPAINKTISHQRAQAVINYLTQKGISPHRLIASGYGDTQPVTINSRAINGQDVNRRVEMKILSK
jgi:outer membrane protein OmpA-like peptidoglycan-associated protein